MVTIATANRKGGTGKTTNVVNTASGLALLKKRVLAIDLDPQCHLTKSLGVETQSKQANIICDVLIDEERIQRGIQTISSGQGTALDLLPGSHSLAKVESDLKNLIGGESRLKKALKAVTASYDFILIDCPPNLGMLTINALVAADTIFVPLQMEFLPVDGLAQLMDTVSKIKEAYNPSLELGGIIGTFWSQRKRINREVHEQVKDKFKDVLFKTLIRDNVYLKEAPSHGKNIFEYKPGSAGAIDYMNLCKEIVRKYK